MTPAEWEALCRRCGACCFEKKITARGEVLTTAVPCRFLDVHERTCRVYATRFRIEKDCIKLTPENIGRLTWLPRECAYRAWLADSLKDPASS